MTATLYRSAAADADGPAPAQSPSDTAWAPLIVSMVSLTLVVLGLAGLAFDAEPLRAVGFGGYLLFGMGAAPWALNRRMGLSLRLTLSTGGSMTVLILVSTAMLSGNAWHPAIAAAVAVALTLPLHILGAFTAIKDLPVRSIPWPAFPPALGLALVGAALCAVAALTHRHLNPGLGGFLTQIGPLWYVGLGLILVSIAVARSGDEVALAVAVVLLMLVLTGTAALVYDGPRSQSAAKHIEFVEQIRGYHYLRSSMAVYNHWPGYFSAMAWLSDVAGLRDPIGLATGWPVIVGVVRLIALRFLAGQLINGKTLPWLAVGFGVLADTVGQDYFSPQSVGFVLGLMIFGLALAELPLWPKAAAMTVAGSAVTVAHQLSPFVIGGTLCVLVVFRQVRPWWMPATVLGPAAVWAVLQWSDIRKLLSLGEVGNADNFRPPSTSATPGLHRLPIVPATVAALVAGVLVIGIVALAVLVRRRRDLRTWALAVSPAVGLAIVTANPYGNEGIFRAILFAVPWLAVLAAQAFAKAGEKRIHLPLLATILALAVTFNVASFGLDATTVLRPADRHAVHAFEATVAAPGQTNYLLVLGPGDLPITPPTQARTHVVFKRSDFDRDGFPVDSATPDATMRRLTAELVAYARESSPAGTHVYAIWSPVSSTYGREYGIHTGAQFAAFRDAFGQSPSWKTIFSEKGTVLFEYTSAAEGGSGS